MERFSLWLSLITAVAMALLILPGVIAMNRGRMVRNIAFWLCAFVLLGWIYKVFGPFGTVAEERWNARPTAVEEQTGSDAAMPAQDSSESSENHDNSFNPPQE